VKEVSEDGLATLRAIRTLTRPRGPTVTEVSAYLGLARNLSPQSRLGTLALKGLVLHSGGQGDLVLTAKGEALLDAEDEVPK